MKRRPDSPAIFGSTVGEHNPLFRSRIRPIPVPLGPDGKFRRVDELKLFWRVLLAAWREHTLLLFSSRGRFKPELLAIMVIALWPRPLRPTIVLYGEMYAPDTGLRRLAEQLIMRLADRAVARYVVTSAAERDVFSQLWGIDPAKIRVCYFTYMPPPAADGHAPAQGDYVFAGGNSFRAYDALIEAARRMPEQQFVICTKLLTDQAALPPNVQLRPIREFKQWLGGARLVVVPLRTDVQRSAGLLTYLEAMGLRKPTIVTDALAVREYVHDGETGLVVSGSPESYVEAIRWALDPANAERVARIAAQAHDWVLEQETQRNLNAEILKVMDELMGTAAPSRSLSGSNA